MASNNIINTQKEIEVKIFEIDADAVRGILRANGAEQTYAGNLQTVHFDHTSGRITLSGGYLRLRRREGGMAEFAYKGRNRSPTVSERDEFQTTVTDADTIERILVDVLGLTTILRHTKHRESYRLGDMKFDIDRYPNIAPFVEVEAPTKEAVKAGVRLLGYSLDQASAGTILDYLKQKDIRPADAGIMITTPWSLMDRISM